MTKAVKTAFFQKADGERVSISYQRATELLFTNAIEKVLHTNNVLIVRQRATGTIPKTQPAAVRPIRFGGGRNVFNKYGKNGAHVIGMGRKSYT